MLIVTFFRKNIVNYLEKFTVKFNEIIINCYETIINNF